MKTRERLLFMTIGGLLVLAGMIVGQFVFSPAQAQAGGQDATFKTVKCERLEVGNSFNSGAVIIGASAGFGSIFTSNASGKIVTSLSADDGGNGLIETLSSKGKVLTSLSATRDGNGGVISTKSDTGKLLTTLTVNDNDDSMINTRSKTGKRLVSIGSSDSGGSISSLLASQL